VNVPYLANADPALATTTVAERDRLLAEGRTLTFGSPDTLAALYAAAGVTPDRSVITYCGRGYAAACGLLALKVLGYQDVRLYDGSWTEWSGDPHLPVEVTPARSAASVG
jgi:thiosulfate/3-mercaptopyruvate sulfurtransferase